MHIENEELVVLLDIGVSQAMESGLVRDAHSLAFNHDIEAFEGAGAGRDDAVRVMGQVHRLALGLARGEVQGAVDPYGRDRRHVGPAVGPHRREPVRLGSLQLLARLHPRRRACGRVTEARVELGGRLVLRHHEAFGGMFWLSRNTFVGS